MICAPSNNAVDTVITRLIEQGLFLSEGRVQPRVVRVGIVDKGSSRLIQEVSLENQVQKAMLSQKKLLNEIEKYSLVELQDSIARLEKKAKRTAEPKEAAKAKEELNAYKQVYFD